MSRRMTLEDPSEDVSPFVGNMYGVWSYWGVFWRYRQKRLKESISRLMHLNRACLIPCVLFNRPARPWGT